jgi:peptide/nickel transport system permease protein
MPRWLLSILVRANRVGALLVVLVVAAAAGAPIIAPHDSAARFPDLQNAPPTAVHILQGGTLRTPYVHPWKIASRLEQRYEPDVMVSVPLVWFRSGRLVSSDDRRAPLLLFGADSYGRDVFSRLLFGARVSLALSLASVVGSLILGGLAGAAAGYAGGPADEIVMRTTEFATALPATYVALALRAALPSVLAPSTVFLFLAAIFAVVGAPLVSRGVRAIIRTERRRDYASAALSLGAGHGRLLFRHLMPATRGFVAVQATMLAPAFIVAEATLSFVGFGFADPVASWGTMLQDASNVRTFADFPWLLSPAMAIFLFVLGLNLLLQEPAGAPGNKSSVDQIVQQSLSTTIA